jgi:Holliday junction resolvase RusA-like endonuclease
MAMIRFEVVGKPVTQGSMRAGVSKYGTPFVKQDHRASLMAWRHSINDECRDAMAGQVAFTGPVEIDLLFRLARPAGHYGARGLKPSAPAYPIGRVGDLDKMIRAALDALKDVAYRDDSQVVSITARKVYAAQSQQTGVTIAILGEEFA